MCKRLTTATVVLAAWMSMGCQLPSVDAAGTRAGSGPMEHEPFWAAGTRTAEQRFALARRSTPELVAFLRRMPKGADLHNHLGGSLYADFLIEAAMENGKRFDLEKNHFTDADGEGTVTMDAFLADQTLIARFRNQISIRGYLSNGGSGHDHFFAAFQHIGTAGRAPASMLAEVLARNHYQNVQYLELMANTAPPELAVRFSAALESLDLTDLESAFAPFRSLVSDPEVHAAFTRLLDGLEAQTDQVLRTRHGLTFADAPAVRYVPQLDRVGTLERFFVSAILFMAGMQADPRIVAINMVAPEDLPTSRLQFDAQMQILDFLWQRLGRPNLTLHAGELSLRESPVEPMRDRIRRSIDEGHARRIGHGVSVAWERDLVGLLQQMAEQEVLVEVVPSSAEVILGISGDDHPFRLYRAAGVPMCISTDDEGVSRSNLTMEYVKVVQRYDLGYGGLKALVRNCLTHAFLDDAERGVQLGELDRRFAAFEESLANGFRER